MKAPLLIASLLLLIAIASMPYGYYQFLRIAITIFAGITAYNLYEKKQNNWLVAFITILILYNPVCVIHFERAIWMPINLITAVVFTFFAFVDKNKIERH